MHLRLHVQMDEAPGGGVEVRGVDVGARHVEQREALIGEQPPDALEVARGDEHVDVAERGREALARPQEDPAHLGVAEARERALQQPGHGDRHARLDPRYWRCTAWNSPSATTCPARSSSARVQKRSSIG